LFEAKAKEIAANNDYRDREILLSFTCDPYPIIEAEQNITRQAIVILKKNKLRFSVLTKAGKRAAKDFYLLKGYEKCSFGTTLIFTNQKDADIWEPHVASLKERNDTIKQAKKMGIKTWVSLEPVIDPEQALKLIEQLYSYVDHWKVGKINYNKEIEERVDWLKFREDVRNLLRIKAPDKKKPEKYYYLKRSLTAKGKIEVIHEKDGQMSYGHLDKRHLKNCRLNGMKKYDLPYPALLFVRKNNRIMTANLFSSQLSFCYV